MGISMMKSNGEVVTSRHEVRGLKNILKGCLICLMIRCQIYSVRDRVVCEVREPWRLVL